MAILNDGLPTTITFNSTQVGSGVLIANLMEELEVTPPGISGGGANDTTSMRNTTYRTFYPKTLKTLTPFPIKIKYDVALYDQLVNMVNDNQEMMITFPDGSELVFWGWIDEWAPDACVDGAMPTATLTIIPSNMDGDNDNAEISPNYTAP